MATFTRRCVVDWGATGVAASLYVTVYNGSNTAVVARALVTGEHPTGSGLYYADVTWDNAWTSPRVVWDDGTDYAVEDMPAVNVTHGNGEGVNPDDTLNESIDNVLERLSAGTVRIIGQVVGYDLIIGRGESYNPTVGQTLPFTRATGDTWPSDITGWTITLNARKKGNNQNSGTSTLSATGTVVQATGDNQSFRIDLTAAQTTSLAEGHWTHTITLTNGSNVKTLRGNMRVLPELPVDA
jgi:hypothetical protein